MKPSTAIPVVALLVWAVLFAAMYVTGFDPLPTISIPALVSTVIYAWGTTRYRNRNSK